MSKITAELVAHIQAENAKTQAWVDAAPGRMAGLAPDPVEDAEFYIERGIFTVAQYERDNMEATIHDLFKDVHGFRNRYDFKNMSDEDLSKEYDYLLEQLEENNKREASLLEAAINRFEQKINELINCGAGDRETAIRWLREAYNDPQVEGDAGYFEYLTNLPYGYLEQEVA